MELLGINIWIYVLSVTGLIAVLWGVSVMLNKRKKVEEKEGMQTNLSFSFDDSLKELETLKDKPKQSIPSRVDIKSEKVYKLKEDEFYYKGTDFKGNEVYYKANPYNYWNRSKLKARYWLDRRMAKKFPHKVVLINMELANKRHRHILVKEDSGGFTFNKKQYVFDDNPYYIIDNNIWCYDFHEFVSFPVKLNKQINQDLLEDINKELEKDFKKPIKKLVDVPKLYESVKISGITEVETAINPESLDRFIKSQVIQSIMQGASLGKVFKILMVLTAIVLIVAGLNFILDIWSSGLIEQFQK